MTEETLNLDKLTLEDNDTTVEIKAETEKSTIPDNTHPMNREQLNSFVLEGTKSKGSKNNVQLHNKAVGLKRKHVLEEKSNEQMEKMARLVIEDSMSSALIRRCWKCKQSFVKDGECSAVRCVCGAITCYSCGYFIGNNLVTAHLGCAPYTTPGEDQERVRRAAVEAKRALRATHPSLTFKYDPSGGEGQEALDTGSDCCKGGIHPSGT